MALVAVAIVIVLALGEVLLQGEDLLIAYSDLTSTLVNLAAASCLLLAALYSRVLDRRVYIAWMLLALAQFSYVIGDFIFSYTELVLKANAFPSKADFFYLMYYPIFLIGVLYLPSISLKPSDRLKMVLDTGIVMISAVLVFWTLLIMPTIEASLEEDTLTMLLSVAYPVADLVLLFALVNLLFYKENLLPRETISLLSAGIALMIFADFSYMKLVLEDLYSSGNILVDTSWILSFTLIGLAAVFHITHPGKETIVSTSETTNRYGQLTWPLYLPYFCAAGAFLFMVWGYYYGLPISFDTLALAVGCIIGLVIVRQILALKENSQLYLEAQHEISDRKLAEQEVKRLNEELESRVVERTKQLEKANIELQNEIIDRKQAETALRESQRRVADIINFLPDAALVIDNESKVIAWNKAMETLTGIKAEVMMGKGNFEYALPFYGERRPILIDLVLNYKKEMEDKYNNIKRLDDGTLVGEAYMSHLRGGGVYLMGSAAALYDIYGNVAGAIETIRDVTERQKADEELQRAKEKAELAAKAKSEFLANMSHEIRTPMNAVIGMTLLLLETDLTPEQREYIETIWNSGEALLSLIKDILDLSKIEGEKMNLEEYPFDLRACVEESLDLVAGSASEKDLELAYFLEREVPEWILGDLTRLRQVLLNLLGNAVKFTDHGEIAVYVETNPSENGKLELHFSIRDTGIGISQEDISKLFQSFSQIDSSTTRNYGGSGLGLAISKKLVELMGGKIWIESELGKGSTFHFTILASPIQPPAVHTPKGDSILAGKHVLVAEDNATVRDIMLKSLRSWQMKPIEARNGNEALAIIRNGHSFDIVLVDIDLSDIDIISLLPEIRHRTNAPIVAMNPIGHSKLAGLSVSGWLTKPIKPIQLFNLMTKLLAENGERVESQSRVPTIIGVQPIPKRLSILLAEDNPVNQKVALSMLKYLGYHANVAANGIEVLEAMQQESYDVVLMDVQMPQMDGLEAVRRIRETGLKTWIIAMTAYAMDGDREKCIDAGMNDYISKPIKLDELRNALERRNKTPE